MMVNLGLTGQNRGGQHTSLLNLFCRKLAFFLSVRCFQQLLLVRVQLRVTISNLNSLDVSSIYAHTQNLRLLLPSR